jgi:uncharacterized radical SAM superfamily Fe-S cluster-containing enzyme
VSILSIMAIDLLQGSNLRSRSVYLASSAGYWHNSNFNPKLMWFGMNGVHLRRKARASGRRLREARMFAQAMRSASHPIVAQIVPTRRCNLACSYCNEYDDFSSPVGTTEMLRRVDRLAALGTTIITASGGEPLLHPDFTEIIRRVRGHGIIATVITNGYPLTQTTIRNLNRAGLDYMQVSIDNLDPNALSRKSLNLLDRKLQWLAEEAEFQVTVNTVLGNAIGDPGDALVIANRARELSCILWALKGGKYTKK